MSATHKLVPSSENAAGSPASAAPAQSWLRKDLEGLKEVATHWTSVFLIFVPLGYIGKCLEWNAMNQFVMNFFAILALANIIYMAIDAVVENVGPKIGGLIEAFLGKTVEQVMAIQCMRANLPDVLKGNLMGSLHWCLCLILGMSLFAAGVKNRTASFDVGQASAQMTCQVVASISIVLPTMFNGIPHVTEHQILLLSRVCAFGIIVTYVLFLYFNLWTHAVDHKSHVAEDKKAMMSTGTSVALMATSIIICTECSQNLVDTIDDVSLHFDIPKEFIGATLLPIIGNTAEHVQAIKFALRGNLDQSIQIGVGSGTQIALFVVPLAVLWGWAFDTPFTLNFREFDAAVMLLNCFLCAQILQHGQTNWLHGAMLMTTYFLIAIITWHIPSS
eukprot:TRINITY_DN20688_c0_g4_i1.p1 TRINITY_DN20688_c0_g4~~TRINITY_DN20688_c0_g4_i1.p1  ORF type:complete len:389 (+),score=89.03 TRINITY_DN20688_c0_g4_i1:110-1276(+)